MSKIENIKQYYINKNIQKIKHFHKSQANEIRINKDKSLKNIFWENSISRINKSFNSKNIERMLPYKTLLGCNDETLYKHLDQCCNISNIDINKYPQWEIDHIKNVCYFDISKEQEQLKYFNYTNLQCLDKRLNRQKNERNVSEAN